MGVERFADDVLEVPNLEAVIIALGVNDVSYLDARTASAINLDTFSQVITTMVAALHSRDVRVTMQTFTPRLGCSPVFGHFTPEMERLRLQLNDWIRTAGIFDYVFDAEAVVREEAACDLRFHDGLHQGDRLHPNEAGGMALAEAYDLESLTGMEPSASQASITTTGGEPALLDYERDHLERIRSGLAECMVLLRKDGAFPLAKPCKLAAYGSGVRHSVKGGTGSGNVNAHIVVNVEQGLRNAGFQLASEAWLDAYDDCRLEAKAAFRKQLKREAKAAGDIVGDEMERFGVNLWLAPALNIHRSILCGRNFEYFSEDPLISGKIAAALTRGVQAHPRCGVTIKHFAANNQEANRYFNNSQVSERTLREIYLRGFEICIRESQPTAVMTSYNLVNGVHTSESRALTQNFLRAECGLRGIVMTDLVLPLKNRGTRWPIARVGFVAAAGGDLFMPGSKSDFNDILTALASGAVGRRQLEENATRVLRMCKRLNA